MSSATNGMCLKRSSHRWARTHLAARTPTSPNAGRAAGGYLHQWWHPELFFRRRKGASSCRSAQLPLFLQWGNALTICDL